MGRGRGPLLILAAASLAVALTATPALAKKAKKKGLGPVVTATASGPVVSVGGTSTASAVCPPGLQAVAGGFEVPFNAAGHLVATESYRSAPNTWRVSAFNGGGTGSATAYAYCRRSSKSITDAIGTATVSGGYAHNTLAKADCPPGIPVVSGGFQITSGPASTDEAVPEESIGGGPVAGTPSVGYWDVAVKNNGTAAQTVTAHVYCMAGIKVPAFRQDETSALLPNLGTLSQSSSCRARKSGKKKGKKRPARPLSSGAFYSPFPLDANVFPVHTRSLIVGGGFLDTAVNAGQGGPVSIQSQAMCF